MAEGVASYMVGGYGDYVRRRAMMVLTLKEKASTFSIRE
jgi:hypothetical protein